MSLIQSAIVMDIYFAAAIFVLAIYYSLSAIAICYRLSAFCENGVPVEDRRDGARPAPCFYSSSLSR